MEWQTDDMTDTPVAPRPTPAGIYDYSLGGTANTAADRAHVERIKEFMPEVVLGAWANRGFLQRAVTRLAGELGVRQFLDLGAGFPTQRNTHEVVAEVRDDGRVVYVDIDAGVVARGREMLAHAPGTATVEADIRDVEKVLSAPETQRLIDFTEPVGLLVVAVTHYLTDEDDPWSMVARYVHALPSGSYLALSAITRDRQEGNMDKMVSMAGSRGVSGAARSLTEIERFFTGLEIVPPYRGAEPTVAYVGLWGAEDPEAADDDGSRLAYAAVARKP
jgi:hypothetical protein